MNLQNNINIPRESHFTWNGITHLTIALTMLVLLVGQARSSDVPLPIRRIEFVSDPTNKIVIERDYPWDVNANPTGLIQYGKDPGRVSSIKLIWNGREMEAESRDVEEIDRIQLDTIRLLAGAYYGVVGSNRYYRCIKFDFGDTMTDDGQSLKASLVFLGWQYNSFSVNVPIPPRQCPGQIRSLIGYTIERAAGSTFFVGPNDTTYSSLSDFILAVTNQVNSEKSRLMDLENFGLGPSGANLSPEPRP